jgi:hypothetical protein
MKKNVFILSVIGILALVSIPITAIVSSTIVDLGPFASVYKNLLAEIMPLFYLISSIFGIRYLMAVHQTYQLQRLEKEKEMELLSYHHLKSAENVIQNSSPLGSKPPKDKLPESSPKSNLPVQASEK